MEQKKMKYRQKKPGETEQKHKAAMGQKKMKDRQKKPGENAHKAHKQRVEMWRKLLTGRSRIVKGCGGRVLSANELASIWLSFLNCQAELARMTVSMAEILLMLERRETPKFGNLSPRALTRAELVAIAIGTIVRLSTAACSTHSLERRLANARRTTLSTRSTSSQLHKRANLVRSAECCALQRISGPWIGVIARQKTQASSARSAARSRQTNSLAICPKTQGGRRFPSRGRRFPSGQLQCQSRARHVSGVCRDHSSVRKRKASSPSGRE